VKSTGKWNLALRALALFLISTALAANAPVQVPLGQDLRADGRSAQLSGRAIVLVFSARDCSYCELLEANILRPNLISGHYDDQIILRKLLLDSHLPIQDFDGQRRAPAALSRRYRVHVTPTVLFVDAQGNELAPRLVGINTVEMYGGYLDDAIQEARRKLTESQQARAGGVAPL
jgi:thioredoxin-related protein